MVEIQNELKTSLSELNVDIGYSSTILGLEPEITSNGIEARHEDLIEKLAGLGGSGQELFEKQGRGSEAIINNVC